LCSRVSKFLFSVNPEATFNRAGIFISIALADQGADVHISSPPFVAKKSLFQLVPFLLYLKSHLFAPGPLTNGFPALSNATECSKVAQSLSVLTFQSDSLQNNATYAGACQGVLLSATGQSATARCACKFLVPHFSSFGVSVL
jgi:hypothetical protein